MTNANKEGRGMPLPPCEHGGRNVLGCSICDPVPQLHISHCSCGNIECVADLVSKLTKALKFIADDKRMTVDHLRGYADGVLQGIAAEAEGREAGR